MVPVFSSTIQNHRRTPMRCKKGNRITGTRLLGRGLIVMEKREMEEKTVKK